MRLMRMPVFGVALALAVAAPAAAIPGGGLAAALRSGAGTSTQTEAVHTCQAGRNHEKTKLKVTGDARKTAVVACEQPPKSELLPSLKQSATDAATTFG